MGVKGLRPLRIAHFIQRELGTLLLTEVQDPRLKRVVITRVEVSADLRHADVFIRSLEGDVGEVLPVLCKAAPFLYNQIKPHLHIKYAIALAFKEDKSVEAMERMEKLLEENQNEPLP